MMKLLLANPRGFCAGVEMAIASVEQALLRFGTPLYVYHEIVHNTHVVRHFRDRGVVFVEDLTAVPHGSHLLYSAHGVSPEVRRQAEQRKLQTIDATCPLVAKVHREAVRYAREGYSIVLVGHAGHDEAVGTLGEAPGQIQLVETPADVERLVVADPAKVAYLTQTTLSIDDADRIISRLKIRFPSAVGPATDDICYATQNRQEALKELLSKADMVLVLGSRSSSNSNRLAEIATESGKSAHLVDDIAEIDPKWFQGDETVAVTAGASAPEALVAECVEYLRDRFGAVVKEQKFRAENVHFPLPQELRDVGPHWPKSATAVRV